MNAAPKDIRNRLLVARLPSPPRTLIKLLAICQSDEVGLAELAQLISQDPAMSAKVMSVAHSAAYHREDQRPLSLLQATSTLGTALIKVLVISESVFQTFNGFGHTSRADLRPFWKHSLGVAVLARELAGRFEPALSEDAYLAGLLHDVGRLALLAADPERCAALFNTPDDTALCRAERQALGLTHEEAGSWLLKRWQLSEAMVESVLMHHVDPLRLRDTFALTRVVHLAHRLDALAGQSAEAFLPMNGLLGLSTAELIEVAGLAAEQVNVIARDMGLNLGATPAPPASAAAAARAPDAAEPVAIGEQAQLVQEVINRSVLNEMALTLIRLDSGRAVLNSLREHAGALLQLDDNLVMIARDKQRILVPVSMSERHLNRMPLSFDVAFDPTLADCVRLRQVVFIRRGKGLPSALLEVMQADEVVLLPLVTAQRCLGVVAAVVPADMSAHIHTQSPMLQAFGVYAGLALSRRHQAEKARAEQLAQARQEHQVELEKLGQAIQAQLNRLNQSLSTGAAPAAELGGAIRELIRPLQEQLLVPSRIELGCELPDRPCWVRGPRALVQMVVLALLKNASESMPDGGSLSLEAGALVQRKGSMYTALSVTDTGLGLPPTLQAQLYEPAAPMGASASAGLTALAAWLDRLGGHLKFTTGATGTRFDVLLPCSPAPG